MAILLNEFALEVRSDPPHTMDVARVEATVDFPMPPVPPPANALGS